MSKEAWLSGLDVPCIPVGPNVVPDPQLIFRSLEYFVPKRTKCIIVGQDPYPDRALADGLAFSSLGRVPPSLRAILMELFEDTGARIPQTGTLEPWALEGVLLLNRSLTVREGRANSHSSAGWQELTAQIVQKAIDYSPCLSIIMWGNKAQELLNEVRIDRHVLPIVGGHPSPLNNTRPFKGGRYFSRANLWLARHGIEPIDWRLVE